MREERNDARSAALRVLRQMDRTAAWADAGLDAELRRSGLAGQEAALAARLVYGVLQNRALLDHYLGAYCSQKIDHLQKPLADILRLGAYQIVFLDRVPDSAAVNTSVELCRDCGRGQASGLVNAVLRKVAANKDNLPPVPERDAVAYLATRYSHPKWLVRRLLALLGREEAEAFLRADNAPAPITVQTNTLLTAPEALRASLEAEGVRVTPGLLPGSFQLRGTGNLTKLAAFQAGHFQVQDDAAALVTEAMDLRGGEAVLDVCAAPGGKSFRCAMAMGDKGRIVACDLYENKLRRIEAGAKRLHLTAIETAALDGRFFRVEWENAFDVVLVDAPCSGLGIIRKKPEIRYKKADDLFALPVVQTAILENASRYVKPGGQLLYSTCTILPEENGQVTDEFLAGHPDFRRESFALPVGEVPEGQITLWPQRQGTDGFYICRMRKAT